MLHQDKQTKKQRSDEWWTPQDLFDELVKKFKFKPTLDSCATKANRLCGQYFSKKQNALTRRWIKGRIKRKVWCNPPNSIMKLFLKKAYEQWRDHKIQTMMIVPLNIQSSNNFWTYVQEPMERGEKIMVRPIKTRRSFLYKGQDTDTSINGYCIIIFGRRNKFQKTLRSYQR